MVASEMIAKLRSTLRDDAGDYWGDPELIHAINASLSAVAIRFLLWKGRYAITVQDGIDTYAMPSDYMAPLSVGYRDGFYPIVGTASALVSDTVSGTSVFFDNDAMVIYPLPIAGSEMFVNYYSFLKIDAVTDIITLPDFIHDAVLYYALSVLLQKQPSEESLSQSKYYMDRYESQCAGVEHIAHMRRSAPRNITSRFQKV